MYTLSVPFFPATIKDRNKTFELLEKAGTHRVFLATEWIPPEAPQFRNEMELLRDSVLFFKEKGFEVGIWMGRTIGHGGPLSHDCGLANKPFRLWVDANGTPLEDNFCPTDEKFISAMSEWVKNLATLNPDLIMLDDDFRLTMRGDAPGCLCDWHLKEYNRRVGAQLTREEIKKLAFCGKPNIYREKWFELQGEALYNLAREFRKSLDTVNDKIRLGFCSGLTSWDFEGSNPLEISKILAGNTKPFMRLSCAPYWAKRDYSELASIINGARQISHWCKESGVEIFSEGDTYPRPRFASPAAFLEQFDTCLRADGSTDGILKYMLDYVSSIDYESGYLDNHFDNMQNYEEIDKLFSLGKPTGIQIFEHPDTFRLKELPEECVIDGWYGWNLIPSPCVKFISQTGLPVTFENDENAVIVFDESAHFIDEKVLGRGLILNITAAEILKSKGIDVGFNAATELSAPNSEFFVEENQNISLFCHNCDNIYELDHKDGVRVLSRFNVNGKTVEGVYEYENEKGQRFLVLPFKNGKDGLARSYCRQRQLAESVAWLSGKALPAVCNGQTELFTLCKADEKTLTIGLWNNGPDKMFSPEIALAKTGKIVKTLNADAEICGNVLKIKGKILPFSFAAIQIEY